MWELRNREEFVLDVFDDYDEAFRVAQILQSWFPMGRYHICAAVQQLTGV